MSARAERYAKVIHDYWCEPCCDGPGLIGNQCTTSAHAVLAIADAELAELEGVLNHERDAACASIQGERVATSWHLTRRAEAAEKEAAELRALIDKVRAATPTLAQLRAASARHDPRPCNGNANVCAAEGCFGEACIRGEDSALAALAESRLSTDDGTRHDLDDVAREFGIDSDGRG